MPKSTHKEKLMIGVYVSILTIIILIIWGVFLKYQFGQVGSNKSADNTFQEIKASFQEFIDSSKEAYQNFKEDIKTPDADQSLTSTIATNFTQLAQEELYKKRTTDWQSWENEKLSLKYPSSWLIEEVVKGVKIKSAGVELEIISINFLANLEQLSVEQWWQNSYFQESSLIPTSQLTIAGQSAIKAVFPDHELIYVQRADLMVEIKVSNLAASEIINDWLQSISFK